MPDKEKAEKDKENEKAQKEEKTDKTENAEKNEKTEDKKKAGLSVIIQNCSMTNHPSFAVWNPSCRGR